jgi:hypothetical protein
MSPLMDMQKRYGMFFRVEELTHANKKKTDRVMWALQGRFENGYITLNKGEWNSTDRVMWALQGRFENGYITLNKGEWNSRFLDQLFQFPDPLT